MHRKTFKLRQTKNKIYVDRIASIAKDIHSIQICAHNANNRKKEKRNLSEKHKRHKNNTTAVKHWFPPTITTPVLLAVTLHPYCHTKKTYIKFSADKRYIYKRHPKQIITRELAHDAR